MNSFFGPVLAVTALFLAPFAYAADARPAYLDFHDIAPAKQGTFVEVDLDQGLLSLAAKLAEGQEKEAAQILRGLKSVHVRVIGLDDANRATVVSRMQEAREKLSADGWKRIALARDGNGQDVAVFARLNGDESIQGIAVTVIDGGREAVVVNVVGDLRPEQISALGVRFGIEPLKHVKVAAK